MKQICFWAIRSQQRWLIVVKIAAVSAEAFFYARKIGLNIFVLRKTRNVIETEYIFQHHHN